MPVRLVTQPTDVYEIRVTVQLNSGEEFTGHGRRRFRSMSHAMDTWEFSDLTWTDPDLNKFINKEADALRMFSVRLEKAGR
jgi:hypothetical protein